MDLEAVVRRAITAAETAPQEYRVAIAASLAGALVRATSVESSDALPAPRPVADVSPAPTLSEVLSGYADRPQTEQIAAIAAFEFRHGRDAVTRDDILGAYKAARMPVPGNLSEMIARCIRRGWLSSAGQRDGAAAVRVTQTGLRLIETDGQQ